MHAVPFTTCRVDLTDQWRELLAQHARTTVRARRSARRARPRDERVRGPRPTRLRLRRAPPHAGPRRRCPSQPERALAHGRPAREGRPGRARHVPGGPARDRGLPDGRRPRAVVEAARPTHRRVLAENLVQFVGVAVQRGPERELQRAGRGGGGSRRGCRPRSGGRRSRGCEAASSVKPRPAIAQATCQASRPVSRRSMARRTLSLPLLTSGPRTRTPSSSAIRSLAIIAAALTRSRVASAAKSRVIVVTSEGGKRREGAAMA